MVRFGVLSTTFWSIGVELVAGAASGCSWLLSWLLLAAPVLGPWRDPKNQVSGGCLRALGKWSDLGCFRVLFGPLA